ncbi:unnamed protein product [Leptidea sinapis]|uniref:Uncharacterized protein n=1 Tax=Leptidea sinapis TaxID=189913 RepID=A0A5E4PNS1_9NEOP|nr:unnamed protein product [Leptidea sinapis]
MKCFLLLILFVSVYAQPCSKTESVNITGGPVFENGSIIFDGFEYASGKWYEIVEDGVAAVFGCPCIGRICLWKCCGAGQAFLNRSCSEINETEENYFSPTVFKEKEATNIVAKEHFVYMFDLSCEKYLVDSSSPDEEIYLQEIASNRPQWHPPAGFCIDMMMDNSSPGLRLVAGVCYPEESAEIDSPLLYTAYAIGLMFSVPFLLATFVVYALIPELRNLHGMCLMSYCAGLIIAYTFLAYLKLHTGKIGIAMDGCYAIGIGYRGSSNKRRENKRFLLYAAYAWGVPAILTTITIVMQFSENISPGVITPGFGSRRCWFDDWLSELVYFFIPVFVLIICNVTLFTITAYRIRSIKQETAILKGAESARSDKIHKDKQRYGLYLKLFVVMGVNWSVEVISFAVGGSNWYWILVDLSNIALGIYIFLIFVWKNKVRNLVAKSHQWTLNKGQTICIISDINLWRVS